MRVWALASCSGLLALAACSAEQSNTPNPSAALPDGDDAVEVNARPSLVAPVPSPVAWPETRPRQILQSSAPPPAASPSAPGASIPGRPQPQADQLRERLQRLQAQQGIRLSAATSLVTAPVPSSLVVSTPSRPAPQPSPAQVTEAQRGLGEGTSFTGLDSGPGAALPTPPRPTSAALPEEGGPAAAPQVSASLARNYPSVPLRHQGYSAQSGVLSAVVPAAEASLPSPRLHGGLTIAQAGEQPKRAAAPAPPQQSVAAVAVVPEHQSNGGRTGLSLARTAAVPQSELTEVHQRSALPSGQSVSLAPSTGLAAQGRPATATVDDRLSGAIALPESLPLHSGAPRLSPPRAAVTPARPEVAAPPTFDFDGAALRGAEAVVASQATGAPDPAPGLQSQASLEPLALASRPSETPKGLPAGYCLSASGQPLAIEGAPEGSTAPFPRFSPSSSTASSPDLSINSGKTALAPGSCDDLTSAPAAAELIPAPELTSD
ncbi:hypothetical protein [Nodosilinea sp. E11]|uniref:hypothetical protein n=1 Tax=Nodosilinea sp. E11 TaxID=3037479 RepID=UPI002934BE79|nr:hypothetical protein [Nodosilinea sp. E11]WOD38591.1 hypothetical protein RRF56_20485 [Nodosilinea sp. E11]